ncbi:MAG: hypothetical protein RDO_0520 [Flavobacteriales endosymbiont of Rhyzopertha dominica]
MNNTNIINILKNIKKEKKKFDQSIDLYINIKFIKNKNNNIYKENINLPHNNGKKKIILALVEKKFRKKIKKLNIDYIGGKKYINKIKNNKLKNINYLITNKNYYKIIINNNINKILIKNKLIPNTNNYIITNKPYKIIKNILNNNIIYLTIEINKVINITIGKQSYKIENLINNYNYIIKKFNLFKIKYQLIIKNIYISSTMGKSIKILL